MKNKYILMFLFFLSQQAWAQEHYYLDRIDIIEHGIYTADVAQITQNPNLAGGQQRDVSNYKLVKITQRIKLSTGVKFGIKYKVIGGPLGVSIPLKMVWIFPKQGLRDSKTGKIFYRNEYLMNPIIGDDSFFYYCLGYDWEKEPGQWIVQIWCEGRKLNEQSFNLVRS